MSQSSILSSESAEEDEMRQSRSRGSVAPQASSSVNSSTSSTHQALVHDQRDNLQQKTEANSDDNAGQTLKKRQHNKYNSMRRQDLIDLHLTLSRRREELLTQLTNVSNVILELAEAYHDLKSNVCRPRYFCELDLLIQQSLVAYDRRQRGANQTEREWAGLISKEAFAKKRRRSTVLAEQPKQRSTDLYDIPIRQLRNEVVDLESDIEIYRKRIALDDKKIRTMGDRWAKNKRKLVCFRYCFLRRIIEAAITEYTVHHK